jgi:hypothetical protein
MGSSMYKKMLLVVAVLASCTAWSQTSSEQRNPPPFEVAVTYDSLYANVTTGVQFWMQGGSVEGQVRLLRGLGVVADVAGLHNGNVNSSGVGLDLITFTFGPRYTLAAIHRTALFGQALVGEAHGMNSEFPTSSALNSSANGLALQVGGGANLSLTHHFSARVLEATWLRTQLANATTGVQNNLRLGAGIVWQFR